MWNCTSLSTRGVDERSGGVQDRRNGEVIVVDKVVIVKRKERGGHTVGYFRGSFEGPPPPPRGRFYTRRCVSK